MKKILLLAALTMSVGAFAQVATTSFEEPAIFGVQYIDTGDANVAHDLVNNANEPIIDAATTAGEVGYDARYEPYDTPSDGLTDGDFVGVTDFTPTATTPYTDGDQGYQISDADGNFILEFDQVDLTGATTPTISIDYFVAGDPDPSSSNYEGDGTVNESSSDRLRVYVRDITNNTEIDIIDTTGNDIDDLGIEGSWITGTAIAGVNATVQLVIEVRCNAGSEAFFFDNVIFGDGILASNEQNEQKFAIYPNPATAGVVNITSASSSDKEITVYDVLGKLVIDTTISSNSLDISSLTSGVYIVKIEQDGISATKKLVVR